MDEKKKKNIIIGTTCTIIIIIIILALILRPDTLQENTIITMDDEKVETYKIEISDFYPGFEKDYKIIFDGDIDKYNVSLQFYNDNGGLLKDYLNIEIETKDETLIDTMNYFLKQDNIQLGKGIDEITIKYIMPEEVGNEAQGTNVKFYLKINISNKESAK